MAALEVRDVTFSYDGETDVLRNINLTLNDGELVCLLGVSGGGKTTLFNIIAGLNRPQKGCVLLNGEDITGKSGRISYMLQKDMLLPYRTVEDNVALPLIIKGMKKKRQGAELLSFLINSGLKAHKKNTPPSFREVCVSVPLCCVPICFQLTLLCLTNPSALLILSQRAICTAGILIS